MKKLYEKNELVFSLLWIIVYVVCTSAADIISSDIGCEKLITFVLHSIMTVFALIWLRRNGLFEKYGLCRSNASPRAYLWYLPLLLFISCNLWFGVKMNYPLTEAMLYIGSMICVGFLEEIIFRGFLFKAMAKDGVKSAVIVSSITFGIGHIVNLFNGSGADLLSNLCQVFYAAAIGFLFVIIFHRGKSLIPCIVTHSAVNSLSVFAGDVPSAAADIVSALIMAAAAVLYSVVLLKTLPMSDDKISKRER